MTSESDKDIHRWHKLQIRVAEASIVNALKYLRAVQIEPILIKGWAISQMYPENHPRLFIDVDLCVNPSEYKKAKGILEKNAANFMHVDLHEGLRHLDNVSWQDLFANSRLIKIEETAVRILRPEDHLRILCTHWLNDGGAYKERLWDIYYALENRPKNFEWNRFLEISGSKRRKWFVCAIALAHKYLGLDLSDTPIAKEALAIPRWVIKTVEKEWGSEVKLKPLQSCLQNKKELFEQIKKRIPPNPIQATIEMEGDFDNKPRIFYQIGDVFFRLPKSIRSLSEAIFSQYKNK